MAVFKLTEWKEESGWHCADVSALAAGSSRWEHHPRIWQLSPVDWVMMLVEVYHATVTMFDNGMIFFYWEKQADERVYKNKTNALARKIGYTI